MLSNYPTHTTIRAATSTEPVRSTKGRSGSRHSRSIPGGVFYESSGSRFLVFPSQGAGTSQGTVIGGSVDDIEKAVAELKEHGVTFEEYDTAASSPRAVHRSRTMFTPAKPRSGAPLAQWAHGANGSPRDGVRPGCGQ